MVTGPALTSSTSIMAPKRPLTTGAPRPRASSISRSISGLGVLPRRRRRVGGAPSLPGVRHQRELGDHAQGAAHVEQRAVHAAGVVGEDTQVDELAGELRGLVGVVLEADPDQHTAAPRPCGPTSSPATVTRAERTRWATARTGQAPPGPAAATAQSFSWSAKRPP